MFLPSYYAIVVQTVTGDNFNYRANAFNLSPTTLLPQDTLEKELGLIDLERHKSAPGQPPIIK
jgi:hypothetical protein